MLHRRCSSTSILLPLSRGASSVGVVKVWADIYPVDVPGRLCLIFSLYREEFVSVGLNMLIRYIKPLLKESSSRCCNLMFAWTDKSGVCGIFTVNTYRALPSSTDLYTTQSLVFIRLWARSSSWQTQPTLSTRTPNVANSTFRASLGKIQIHLSHTCIYKGIFNNVKNCDSNLACDCIEA